jgi:hypothetical protein
VLLGQSAANAINLSIMGPAQAGPSGQHLSASCLTGNGLFGKKDGSSSSTVGSTMPKFPATGLNRDGSNKRRDMPVKFGKLDFVRSISNEAIIAALTNKVAYIPDPRILNLAITPKQFDELVNLLEDKQYQRYIELPQSYNNKQVFGYMLEMFPFIKGFQTGLT